MNKTFKRVLASMLAILMIICSMPFTVSAAELNRKWWENEGITEDQITGEPSYIGYNSSESSENHPEGSMDFALGDPFTSMADDLYGEDLRDEYKPILGLTVSDVGTKGDLDDIRAKYRSHYTYNADFTAENSSNILDPNATLKPGQRIGITVEAGGFDTLCSLAILGKYDTTKLKSGYYNAAISDTATSDRSWKYVTTSALAQNAWRTSDSLYNNTAAYEDTLIKYDAMTAYNGRWGISAFHKYFTTGGAELSVYIGNRDERPFNGKYGLVLGTVYFEVQEECKVKDVITFDESTAGVIFIPYHPNMLLKTGPGDENCYASIGDSHETFANIAVAWNSPEGGSEECTHANTTTTTEVTTAATCETAGVETVTETCNDCGEVVGEPTTNTIPALGHNYVEVEGSAVAPTVDAAGKEADQKCTRCDDVIAGAAIPALASYEITVAATDLGVITLNGADVTDGAKVKVEAGSTVTLTAEPIEGAKFLGWTANGLTTVSTDTTFTTVALANVTYTPVFEKADAASFTVVFADAFGNIVSSQVVTDGSQIVIPDAPARSGYVAATENGWTMTNEEIQALTSSATVIAVYELAENEGYTVTANGATITGDGIEATDVATGVAYDTLVTVYKEGAKGWAVNGVTVAYGDTYSFYVGKDIEVVAVMDGVTAVPMVANVGVNEVGQPGRIQAQFIATRTMADGYTYIDSGFVYGKGDLGEITLFDVDGSAVKAAYTKTASEQFSVTYGLSAQTGTITARAFIAYANADGEVTVTYGAPMTYQYK